MMKIFTCISAHFFCFIALTTVSRDGKSQIISKTVYKNGGSTPATSFNVNDVANYVIQIQGSTPASAPTLADVMSNNQQYIANSVRADNWTLLTGGPAAWFTPFVPGTNIATAIYAGPLAPTRDSGFIPVFGENIFRADDSVKAGNPATSVSFTGGGDGYWPIYWKTDDCEEKVMVKNHHSQTFGIFGKTDSLKCWNLTTNESCNDDFTFINSNLNYQYTYYNAGTVKVNNRVYTVDKSTAGIGFAQFNCIDLNPSGNPYFCPGYPVDLGIGTVGLGYYEVHGLFRYDQGNNRIYYAADDQNNGTIRIIALDLGTNTVSMATITDPVISNPAIRHDYSKAVFLTAHRLVIESGQGATGNSGNTLCVDISGWPALKDCNPSNPAGVFTHYGTVGERVSPLLDNTGSVTGFCTGLNSCYNLNGGAVPMPAGYIPSSEQLNNFLIDGTKVITMKGYSPGMIETPYIYCYDFATNTPCGNTNGDPLYRPYGMDWRVPGKCFLVYGDGGTLTQWGIESTGMVKNSSQCLGNACGQFAEILPDPVNRFCGPQVNDIQYTELRLTNLPAIHSGAKATINCAGVTVATYSIPSNASMFVQNISGVIDHSLCPNPEVRVYIPDFPAGVLQVIRTEVTYSNNGRFPEICYDASFTTCDGHQLTNTAALTGGGVASTQATTSVSSGCIPVPVTLIDFTASTGNCETTLNWHTGEELSFDRFEIVKSTDDGINFKLVATVPATGSGSAYTYIDNQAEQGRSLYCLKMIDIDGKIRYSKILLVSLNCNGKQTIVLFPNPVKNIATVTGLKTGDQVDLRNATGQIIFSRICRKEQEQIDLGSYPAGIYAVIISNKEARIATIKVVKK